MWSAESMQIRVEYISEQLEVCARAEFYPGRFELIVCSCLISCRRYRSISTKASLLIFTPKILPKVFEFRYTVIQISGKNFNDRLELSVDRAWANWVRTWLISKNSHPEPRDDLSKTLSSLLPRELRHGHSTTYTSHAYTSFSSLARH
jgi:hypothetical protein